jgi:hypothetical protein
VIAAAAAAAATVAAGAATVVVVIATDPLRANFKARDPIGSRAFLCLSGFTLRGWGLPSPG